MCTLACAVFAAPASAAPDGVKAECLGAYEQGQRQRKAAALIQARTTFAFCASASCPSALHADCSRWLAEVEEVTPKATFYAISTGGEPLDRARIRIDGGESQPLDGRPLELDPGVHVGIVERAEYSSTEHRFEISEGETLALKIALAPVVAAPGPLATAPGTRRGLRLDSPTERQRLSLTPIWIGASLGIIGVVGFTYFGLEAREADRSLESCVPSCDPEKVERVERDYLLANISLGVGALGVLGAGAWALFGPRTADTSVVARGLELHIGPVTRVSGRF